MPTILVPADVADRLHEELAAFADLECIAAPEGVGASLSKEQLDRIGGAFFDTASGPIAVRRVLGAARRASTLSWMHVAHSGTDDPIFQELMDREVVVTNSAGVTAEPIAQSVMAGLLALNRGIPRWLEAQCRHAWEAAPLDLPAEQHPPVLQGQRMLIFGLGGIGGFVARCARAFGIHVVGMRRTPATAEDGIDEWAPPERLAELLPTTQILVITAPLTSQTRGAIDAAALDLLPRGAIVINVGRGEIVDESALADRLAGGQLGGAYLDVFAEEPLPEDSPLWDLPNVIVSPHESGRSAGARARTDAIFLEELGRWLRGEESPRRVLDR